MTNKEDLSFDKFQISIRTMSLLKQNKFKDMGEVLDYVLEFGTESLIKCLNFGRISAKEIETIIKEYYKA